MSHLKMIRKNNSFYLSDNAPNENITTIYYFLSDDVGSDGSSQFKKWIVDPSRPYTNSNFSSLEKEGMNIIISWNLDQGKDRYKNAVTVSAISLYNFLTEWEIICKAMPEEVTIYLEGTELRVTWR